jgi:hypothetical protein
MPIIGPTGKDMYPCVAIYTNLSKITAYPFIVEAVSSDEALGLANRIAVKVMPPGTTDIHAKVGMSECVTYENARIVNDTA